MPERVIAIIPARGGSKGLPRKNVQLLGGRPLIAWTIDAAKACPWVERVLVSTDDDEIAEVAKACGADVPFRRPGELSHDTAATEAVLQHALAWLEAVEGQRYDVVLYLQATDPFRREDIVSRVVKTLLDRPELETVFAGRPDHKNYWTRRDGRYEPLDQRGHPPRQLKPHVFREDTGIACATRAAIIRAGRRIGERVEMIPHTSPGDGIDIHTEFDLWLANVLIAQRHEWPNEPVPERLSRHG